MTWPGLVGTLSLAGPGLATAWPLLQFAEAVGLGKATTFGFGQVRASAGTA
jgi:CRISPR/Cas system endoribonuclease Cas6 (RAMP superfamily)